MKISGRRNYIYNLESVAMTDIVMNMFIFFFISFSLLYTFDPNRTKGINVKLPKAQASESVDVNSLAIVISSEDIIYISGKPVTVSELDEFIKKDPPDSVLIKADRDASVGSVVKAWDACKKYGIDKIGIATAYGE